MLIKIIERLEKGKEAVPVKINLEAIDFIGEHSDEAFAETCIVVMRSGTVLWLNITSKELNKIMAAYK